MIRTHVLALAVAVSAVLPGSAYAVTQPAHDEPFVTDPAIAPSLATARLAGSPAAAALSRTLASLPIDGTAQEIKERSVLIEFYEARENAPLWMTESGWTRPALAVIEEFKKAKDWGLEPQDFVVPKLATAEDADLDIDDGAIADAEVALSAAILKYARYARGGRIIDPTILLNSNLDRKPKLLDPRSVMEDIATSDSTGAFLRGLHPQHPQFEKLRQAYLKTKNARTAKMLRANMEIWRWMPEDLGALHIFANVPEFMVHLVKGGERVYSERIVVGEVGKQTTIFTRNLKTIVFKPMWRVPESIKVRELWPDLRRNASMWREHGLELESKDGVPLDYRQFDWSKTDIRDFEVVQPPGPKNVMGVVKFTFPSQHTIFMHDTIDKWMFGQKRRTLSHGCLRLRNPMRLVEKVLAEDKGWDSAKIRQVFTDGGRNNEIVIDREIPVHLVYFTAWIDDKGDVQRFADVYGHEKRIVQALDGEWDKIDVGRDHLAPVKPVEANKVASPGRRTTGKKGESIVDMVGNALGGGF